MAQAPQGVVFNTDNGAEHKSQGPNVGTTHFSAQQYAEHLLQQANAHNIVPPSRTNFHQNNIPLQTIDTDGCKSSDEYQSSDEYSVSQLGSISRTVYFPKPARDDTPATYLRTVTRRTLCSQFDQLSVRVQPKAVSTAEIALKAEPDEQIATPLISKFNQTAGEADEETTAYNSPELVAWGQDNGGRRPQIKQGLQQVAHTAVSADAANPAAAAPKANAQCKHIGKVAKPAHPMAAKPPAAKKVLHVPSKPAFGKRLLTTGPSNPATKPVNATTHHKPAIAPASKPAGPVNRPATAAARPLPATSNKQILGGTASVKAGTIKPFNPPKWVPVSTAAMTHISTNAATTQPSLAPQRPFLRKGSGGGARRDVLKRPDAGGIASRFAGMKAKPVEMPKPANQLKGGVRKSVASKNRLHKALAMVGKNPEAGVKMPLSKINKKQTGLPAARAKTVATATVATVAAAALKDVTDSQSQLSNDSAAQAGVTQTCPTPIIGQQSTHSSQQPAVQATVTSECMDPATATDALGEQPAAAILLVPDNSGSVYEAVYGTAINAQDDRVLQASVEESALLPELSLHHGCSAALTTQTPVMGELEPAQELMKATNMASSDKTAEPCTANMGEASTISQAGEGNKSLIADSSRDKCQTSIMSCAGEQQVGLFQHSSAHVDEANSLKFGNPDIIKPSGVKLGGTNPEVRNNASGFTFDSPFASICQAATTTKPASLVLDTPSGAVVEAVKMGLAEMENKPCVEVKAAVESEPSLGFAEQSQCEDVVEKEEAPVESGRSSFCFAVAKGGEPTPVGFNSFFGFAPVNGPRHSTPTLVPSFGLQGQWAKATPGFLPMDTSPQVKDAPPQEEESQQSQAGATGASFLVRPYTPFIRHVMTPESLQPTPTPARSVATIPPSIAPICDYTSASAAAMIPLPMTPLCDATPRRGRAVRIRVEKKQVTTTTPKRAVVKTPVVEEPVVTPMPKRGAVIEEPAPSTIGKARRIPASCPPAHRNTAPSSANRFQGRREVKLEELDENTAHAGSKQVLTLSRANRKHKNELGAGELVVTPVRRSTRNSESKSNPGSNRAKELLEITNYCYSPNPSLRV